MAALFNVQVPIPQTREGWVIMDAASPAVTTTAFLPWQPAAAAAGAPPQLQMTTVQFTISFGARCSIARLPADQAAARAATVVRIRFNGAFWSRVLQELNAAGLFAAGLFTDFRSMQLSMLQLALPNPVNLQIAAGDWQLGQDFVLPAGAGAAAVARRQLLAPTRFVALVNVTMLESTGESPLRPLLDLMGVLGPCLTQASRELEAATFQVAARELRDAMSGGSSIDGTLAAKLPDFLTTRLEPFPNQLRAVTLDESTLLSEFLDILEYSKTRLSKSNVEQKRVMLLGHRYAVNQRPAPSGLGTTRTGGHAHSGAARLRSPLGSALKKVQTKVPSWARPSKRSTLCSHEHGPQKGPPNRPPLSPVRSRDL